jgi:hypothetical protein
VKAKSRKSSVCAPSWTSSDALFEGGIFVE